MTSTKTVVTEAAEWPDGDHGEIVKASAVMTTLEIDRSKH